MRAQRIRSAFSLVELMAVIAVISILIAMLLPAVQVAREAARRTDCASHFKQLALAVQSYHSAHGMLPIGNDAPPTPPPSGSSGRYNNFSAHLRLLPYLEEQSLYDRFRLDQHFSMPHNVRLLGNSVEAFHCPSETALKTSYYVGSQLPVPANVAHTNYVGSVGSRWYGFQVCRGAPLPSPLREHHNGDFLDRNVRIRFQDITDGTGKTFLFGERARAIFPDHRGWMWWAAGFGGDTLFVTFHPINKALRMSMVATSSDYMAMYGGVSSFHPGGANLCFVDGSVRFLSENIDSWDLNDDDFGQMCNVDQPFMPERLFQALSTRNGSEAIDGF